MLFSIFILYTTALLGQNCLEAWYNLNGNALDTSGNYHHGAPNGPTLIKDRFGRTGKAYAFDGINDEIFIPHHSALGGYTEMSLVVWLQFPGYDFDGTSKAIVQKWMQSSSSNRAFSMEFDSAGNYLRFKVSVHSTTNSQLVDLKLTDIPIKTWHMVTGVFTGNSLKIYLDSTLKSTNSLGFTDTMNNGFSNLLMASEMGTSDYTRIYLDDVKLYSCALTDAQIDSLYLYKPKYCDIDTLIIQNGPSLKAAEDSAHYQWAECLDTLILMPSDTSQTYVATANGMYAVIIERDGCIDTSACVEVTGVGIDQFDSRPLTFYPNPSSGIIKIDGITDMGSPLNVTVINTSGQIVFNHVLDPHKSSIDLSDVPKGIYSVKLTNTSFSQVERVVMQ